jgi:hypothetical protein
MTSMFCRLRILITVAVMIASLLLPAYAVAQGRGHGRGLAKKPFKFVNGHDARDGRWDGRGPNLPLSVSTRGRGRHRGWMNRSNRRVRALRVR